jgi:peptidoglycan hydrolase-like protein with peptidoglycan-binding domain
MRRGLLSGLLVVAATAAGLVGVSAAPAAAALPTCYRLAPLDTGHIGPVNVPSAGSTPESTSCILKRGNRNAAVVRLQQTLNACYDNPHKLEVDGVFGGLTEAALRRTQAAHGIGADGVYGPITRDTISWSAGGGSCVSVDGPGGCPPLGCEGPAVNRPVASRIPSDAARSRG